MNRNLQPERFLRADSRPDLKARLRSGDLVVQSSQALDGSPDQKVPGGMLQDWVGMLFIPGATLDQVKNALRDYSHYKNFYRPEVIESKELAHTGDDYDVFLRLYEKQIITVVLNTTYHVRYEMLDAQRMSVTSRSTRIAEVKDPDRSYTEEVTDGGDTGVLWRLNSYWRFEAADGGVYAECEAISLSRDVPLGLGWMIKGLLEKFPKQSMQNTLRGTKAAVDARNLSSPSPAIETAQEGDNLPALRFGQVREGRHALIERSIREHPEERSGRGLIHLRLSQRRSLSETLRVRAVTGSALAGK